MTGPGYGRPVLLDVGCDLTFGIPEHTDLALQVAPATTAGAVQEETVAVTLDGADVAVHEVAVAHGGRIHRVVVGPGELVIAYRAVVEAAASTAERPTEEDALVALRQSRYCPSDAVEAFAEAELAHLPDGPHRAREIAAWVHRRLTYELGSSTGLHSAVDTLLAGKGVCRDFAHVTVTLCRAVGIPARLTSVYAPGLTPMDFHAVAEVVVDGRWEVLDATRLAPRSSLLRIATGRDAADTAFASTVSGWADLLWASIHASVRGDLPDDDHTRPVLLV